MRLHWEKINWWHDNDRNIKTLLTSAVFSGLLSNCLMVQAAYIVVH